MAQYVEHIFLERWLDAWVPRDRRVVLDVTRIVTTDSLPVLTLQHMIRTHDVESVRYVIIRSTFLGAWIRRISTISSATCRAVVQAAGFEVIAYDYGLIARTHNVVCAWLSAAVSKLPLLRNLCHYELLVLRVRPGAHMMQVHKPSVSIIMPCRNEEGTVAEAVRRMPALGSRTELICIDGHSHDATLEVLHRAQKTATHLEVRVLSQTGTGKKNAVVEGCDQAQGDIIIIFDSDMTVAPEDMQAFYNALVSRSGDIINGSRLMFPLPPHAMRWPNFFANHVFAVLISYTGILGQRVTDTLCGTKACWRRDYQDSRKVHTWLWKRDPFGDFAWLFGIIMLGGKVCDVPVRYYARTYGAPIQHRFLYGIQLLKILQDVFIKRFVRT